MNIKSLYELYKKHPVVTTDSRNCPDSSIFIALKGDTFNGNEYAQQAIDKGCAYAIVDEVEYANDSNIILVDDCLETLQQLANYHRRQLTIPVIGITGTNGKTTTKELTSAVLGKKYNVLFTQGNLNNHIGVPLTLLKINSSHEIAVIEMGANHPGEIKTLVEIAEPDCGLITNVGKAHLEGFGSFEGVIRTKGEMYDYLRAKGGKIFIHNENEYLQKIADGIDKITYGEAEGLYIRGKMTGCSPYLALEWSHSDKKHQVTTQLIGGYNLTNALAAAAVGIYFGVSEENISEALTEYQPQNNRSQLKQTERNQLIIDAYNANPSSMQAAVTNFGQMEAAAKVLILGDMFELGENSAEEHQKVVDLISQYKFDVVLLCGENFATSKHNFKSYLSTADLLHYLQEYPINEATVLIKGSRGMKLEQTIEWL
ncbi:UDP-N-acetylmuramoyl-tripeptide--D-alanyl-D-alanine ligase [Parabacteroides sp. FAFU027]|uniref:UDP-N-acetylmuramoyl-tripeptide--D-alanyl-D- alanine ligase n=1 Tax=Parabacteroides sp. FAFU027 TaxID=2922715 RepID=UPI001FAE9D42|nr:UDP-N-acetylmuramoyl-tripeptide--D-alanyl-D-alanine ligase [Parabacteroides sp. FAFU027]